MRVYFGKLDVNLELNGWLDGNGSLRWFLIVVEEYLCLKDVALNARLLELASRVLRRLG